MTSRSVKRDAEAVTLITHAVDDRYREPVRWLDTNCPDIMTDQTEVVAEPRAQAQ